MSNAANTSPYPVSFSSVSPMPCKRWPPFSKDLRLIESWGYKTSQRSSVCPNACPCPESLSTKGMVLQPCKKLIMKLMPVVLPALSFVPTAPWLLILPHVPTIALHRVSTWPTALPTWDWRPRNIVYRGTRCQQSTEEKILNRPKKKSKTIRNLSCSVISSSAGKIKANKQTKPGLKYWDHGGEKQERNKMKIS